MAIILRKSPGCWGRGRACEGSQSRGWTASNYWQQLWIFLINAEHRAVPQEHIYMLDVGGGHAKLWPPVMITAQQVLFPCLLYLLQFLWTTFLWCIFPFQKPTNISPETHDFPKTFLSQYRACRQGAPDTPHRGNIRQRSDHSRCPWWKTQDQITLAVIARLNEPFIVNLKTYLGTLPSVITPFTVSCSSDHVWG